MASSTTVAPPPKPWHPAPGHIDAIQPKKPRSRVAHPGELAQGEEGVATGWILSDEAKDGVVHTWLDAEGDVIVSELPLTVRRPDAVSAVGGRPSDECGFAVTFPVALPPGTYNLRIVAETKGGRGIYVASPFQLRVLLAASAAPVVCEQRTTSYTGGIVAFRDTQPAALTFDRGPHTVRAEASLHLRGFVGAPGEEICAFFRISGPCADAWYCLPLTRREVPSLSGAVGWFDVALALHNLDIGCYDATLYVGDSPNGVYPVTWTAFELAGPHNTVPIALTELRQGAQAKIERFESAAPRRRSRAAEAAVIERGAPILLTATYRSPLGGQALAAYAIVDRRRPLPLTVEGGGRIGGIIDTARLEPGEHLVEVLAVPPTAHGWHVIERRPFIVADR